MTAAGSDWTVTESSMKSVCWPTYGVSDIDRLRVRGVVHGWRRLLAYANRVELEQPGTALAACAAKIRSLSGRIGACTVVGVFDRSRCSIWKSTFEPCDLLQALLALAGHPDVEPFSVVLPGTAAECRLYVPQVSASLRMSSLPVALDVSAAEVAFTWPDGVRATLRPGAPPPMCCCDGRLQPLAVHEGLLLMNGSLAGPEPGRTLEVTPVDDIQTLRAGWAQLREAWPESYDSCRRTYDAAFLMSYDEHHVNSLTHGEEPRLFMCSARDSVQVADALVHESAHARLAVLLTFDPLLENGDDAIHPSPWRPDSRPLTGVLNGLHAFVCVRDFYKRLARRAAPSQRRLYQNVVDEQQARIKTAWTYLKDTARPTIMGRAVLSELASAVEGS